jgi:molecular chaperone GrpE (heat shock protein)
MTESFEEIPQTAEDGSAPLGPATSPDPAAGGLPDQSAAAEPVASDEPGASADSDSVQEGPTAPTADPIGDLTAAVTQLVTESEKHHARAAHRETVIDNLHAEVEKLRTGERRGTIRPLLMSVARIRDDLMRQAADLPGDFDAVRAQKLLHSFADSIEIVLDDYGVSTATPAVGDEFDARRHKAVSSTPTADVALVRTIASVRRDGYQDIEAGVSLKQAEVVVYVEAPVTVTEPAAADPVAAPKPPVAPAADAPLAEAADAPAAGAADERPTAEVPIVAAPMADSAVPAPAFSPASITPAEESRLVGNAESNNAEVIRKD